MMSKLNVTSKSLLLMMMSLAAKAQSTSSGRDSTPDYNTVVFSAIGAAVVAIATIAAFATCIANGGCTCYCTRFYFRRQNESNTGLEMVDQDSPVGDEQPADVINQNKV